MLANAQYLLDFYHRAQADGDSTAIEATPYLTGYPGLYGKRKLGIIVVAADNATFPTESEGFLTRYNAAVEPDDIIKATYIGDNTAETYVVKSVSPQRQLGLARIEVAILGDTRLAA